MSKGSNALKQKRKRKPSRAAKFRSFFWAECTKRHLAQLRKHWLPIFNETEKWLDRLNPMKATGADLDRIAESIGVPGTGVTFATTRAERVTLDEAMVDLEM